MLVNLEYYCDTCQDEYTVTAFVNKQPEIICNTCYRPRYVLYTHPLNYNRADEVRAQFFLFFCHNFIVNRNLSKALTSHRQVLVKTRPATGGIFGGPRGGIRGAQTARGAYPTAFFKKEKKS